MLLSGEIGSGAVALGPPRPSPLTDPRLPPRSYPRRGRGSVRGLAHARVGGGEDPMLPPASTRGTVPPAPSIRISVRSVRNSTGKNSP
eukprot:5927673-Pleurochrysis_carterae.AAC.1